MLTGKGIPVCILNACQSGKQIRSPLSPLSKGGNEDNRETSLGSRLMNAGMQMVVAMSYSVTVTAAEIIMQQIYQHLFDDQDINQAIRLGRQELYNRKGRKAAYNTEIELEDWLLPVVYSNGEVAFNLREFTPEEKEQYDSNLESKYEFTQPTYGFVGRDIDILLIEKALLQHNILLLQGMGGTGKSTLLNYLREWWQVTNFAEDVFYFGYDKRAYTLQQIVFEISKQIYNRFDFARFQAKSINEQWQELSAKLRSESYILILDNLESITGKPLAIQNTLEESDREEIKTFLASLVGGKTKVVLGSRIGEEWLRESTFGDNSYQLQGLDTQARTELAENILQQVNCSKSIDDIKTDEHFQRLMKLLAGYPLAMGVVLANLKNQSPQEILENLEKAAIDSGGEDKTNNIIKCIEYSHSNLSESAQKLLLLLAPFRGFIDRGYLKHYGEQLGKLKPFQDYNLEQLEAAVTEAVNWGLLSPISKDLPQLLTIQPVLPYFLNTKLKEVDQETRAALQEGFKNHYKSGANYYGRFLESKKPDERQIGITFIRWEYENFYQGLLICLEQEESLDNIWICLDLYLGLINNKNEQLKLINSLYQHLSNYTSENSYVRWERDFAKISINLGACYIEQQDYSKAKEIYESTLDLILQFKRIEDNKKQSYLATIYHQLGNVALKSREFQLARDYYHKALDIRIIDGDRFNQAHALHNLGTVAQELRQFQQAHDYYHKALDIRIIDGDRFNQALTLHNLGTVAQELRQFPQAQKHYQQALEIFSDYHDHFNPVRTLSQLGIVALELGEYKEAQNYYHKALGIITRNNERFYNFSKAGILHEFGILAQKLGQYEQAQDYLKQALNIFIHYSDRFFQAKTNHQLGIVAQLLREYQQAHDYYQQALEICNKLSDKYSQGKTYRQLGMLSEELSKLSQARSYYLQALEIFTEFRDQHNFGLVTSNLANLYQKNRR